MAGGTGYGKASKAAGTAHVMALSGTGARHGGGRSLLEVFQVFMPEAYPYRSRPVEFFCLLFAAAVTR